MTTRPASLLAQRFPATLCVEGSLRHSGSGTLADPPALAAWLEPLLTQPGMQAWLEYADKLLILPDQDLPDQDALPSLAGREKLGPLLSAELWHPETGHSTALRPAGPGGWVWHESAPQLEAPHAVTLTQEYIVAGHPQLRAKYQTAWSAPDAATPLQPTLSRFTGYRSVP